MIQVTLVGKQIQRITKYYLVKMFSGELHAVFCNKILQELFQSLPNTKE